MRAPPTEVVAVVVPAHNEQDTIVACLTGIRAAAAHPQLAAVRTEVVVVLDACDDLTAQRAAETLLVSG
ncbi:MAG: hypothetical protein QOK39_1316, partial [Acidimicrobiaceae bacterium]|nr:hypothetical protein [Acidimicrobiaceae bacterium]